LHWHGDAISEVFNFTNGNPYFAKILCSEVFRNCVTERDSDVTAAEVRRGAESVVSSMDSPAFSHLWQDGIHRPAGEREPDILRRMRVLVAIARCLRRQVSPTATNIADNRSSNSLTETEIPFVLNEFQRREILREEQGLYHIVLPIFQMWLIDVGVSHLVSDSLNEELANAVIAEENAATVQSKEVVSLAQSWPTYRGRHIGTDQIRAWYQQVQSPKDQRLLFELLKRTRVFSEAHVRERLKAAHAFIRPALPEFVIRKRNERRYDVLVTYVDGEGKSGASYASLYAEENGIAAVCVLGSADFGSRYAAHTSKHGAVAAIIVVDDIAATGKSFSTNILKFVKDYAELLQGIKIRAITLVASPTAQATILENIQELQDIDVEFRSCEIIPWDCYAFPENQNVWKSQEEEQRAKALCVDLGSQIYRDNPLGFGGLGLLVVFPTTVPNNSLPILHTYSRAGSSKEWKPLFPRVVN
jgi:hypothetical protein